jgi:hypothetical protein
MLKIRRESVRLKAKQRQRVEDTTPPHVQSGNHQARTRFLLLKETEPLVDIRKLQGALQRGLAT